MTNVDVKKLLNPTGAAMRDAVQGAWSNGRVAVAAYWDEIDAALQAGLPVSAIYRALRAAGLVSVTRQAFTRQVKARREGARGSGAAAKPATEPRTAVESVVSAEAAKPDAPTQAATNKPKLPEIKPGIPHRPWRTGPRKPPDPTAVFKPRDPLADD